jgi:hypothetical protein
MKIILLQNSNSPEYVEIVKEGSKNKVFESYNEMDEWFFENNLNNELFIPLILEENKTDLRTIFNAKTF